ncbi:SNF2 family N-terminal domain-containing protein [Cyclonatronum proteinivorum]|uniref:SNF2 family N-terminal domain-containing protein n=1 Tax=Cyclonatronum proteinivorum TaxID=1457365 RepID=A0A345UL82_9BACT|nr:helicase-related protein [Cyclonatronum proteinivorum]AXJ01234.1 SNF2 family N-terminal domain-containing protein [Cyclonatronum proteinivorum]
MTPVPVSAPAAQHSPGELVRYRDRRWIVLPSPHPDIILLKPLGGSDQEITGVHRKLRFEGEDIVSDSFPEPEPAQLGAFRTARLLYDAARLSFRHASGPFRCMGKISFRPRAYQVVPLVMALKQEVTRLMIADDVGIGKTIEALLILKELLERGEIRNFAVICPPHLCEQWQAELRDKLDIQAEIIRSSTAASLDRRLPDDRSVFFHLPYQVISIDYLKSDRRRALFLQDCPKLVIVDEAHTCALPAGAKNVKQQLRHALLHHIAQVPDRHLLMLTATPHSGKDEEFKSLLGLLNPALKHLDFDHITAQQRRQLADYFIQRKRPNIIRWLNEPGLFPEREIREIPYNLHADYKRAYKTIKAFARGISLAAQPGSARGRMRLWAALALLRGVMSSPAAGFEMLQNRQQRELAKEELDEAASLPNPVLKSDELDSDFTQAELLDNAGLGSGEIRRLRELSKLMQGLYGPEKDAKLKRAAAQLKEWLREGHQPIVFCKYIPTAKYVGEHLKALLPAKTEIMVITSELADEQRREQVELLGRSSSRVLVATDCLSEGINLQEHFTAVLHYDLPWNPNRLEQRDGRVDRFGQTGVPGAAQNEVKAYILHGQDNEIDANVMKVLIRKVHNIHQSIGVTINFGDEAESVMDTVFTKILLGQSDEDAPQLSLFEEEYFSAEIEKARKRGEKLRSIFAHENVSKDDIQHNLNEIDEAIGDVSAVERFVTGSLPLLGAEISRIGTGWMVSLINLPDHLRGHFPGQDRARISFESPTPKGFRYIGRNHAFVEQLCQFMLALAFDGSDRFEPVARVSAIMTNAVQRLTVLVMFRVRNVIRELNTANQVVSEEMYLWGFSGPENDRTYLGFESARELLATTQSAQSLSAERQKQDIERALIQLRSLNAQLSELATERAERLVEAHGRFRNLVGGRRYEKVTPVLPPDIMGLYVLLPVPKSM